MTQLHLFLTLIGLALAVPTAGDAQEAPAQGVTQSGALVFGNAFCRGRLMNAEFAVVGKLCLKAQGSGDLHATDSAFYLLDETDVPLHRFPVKGWMTLIDSAPQSGPLSEVASIGQGFVVLALNPNGRTPSDLTGLPATAPPGEEREPIRIVRGLQAKTTPLQDCDFLA